ncbi:hypothetical protein EBU71_14615, partial [bacterium]|nr:hypothetical protein [Candidatus Elulimicrobium humile]
MANKHMSPLTVFYDADCGFCQASINWLSKDLKCEVKKIPYQSEEKIKKYHMVNLSVANEKMQA